MTVVIKDKITSWEVGSKAEHTTQAQDKVVMAPAVKEKLAERPDVLDGSTYKIKPGNSEHAYYVTITNRDNKPYELFISTKGAEHYQFLLALGRTISAIWRNVPDARFMVEELMAVQDPAGGFWMGGRYIPSIVAAIGGIINRHYESLDRSVVDKSDSPDEVDLLIPNQKENKQQCPKCYDYSIIREEGCLKCLSCGWSKCS